MISKLIEIVEKDKSFIWWFKSQIYCLRSSNNSLTIEDLIVKNKWNYKEEVIRATVFELAKMQCLIKEKEHINLDKEEYKINYTRLDTVLQQCIYIIDYLIEMEDRNLLKKYELITTLPDSQEKRDIYRYLKGKFRSFYDTILALVTNATNEIIIINPFFDNEGVKLIKDDILNKLEQNVKVIIITRCTKTNKDLLREISKFYKNKKNKKDLLKIYDYEYNGQKYKSSTFHAKSIIIDKGKKAYIGSANLTGWGLEEQFELGILIEDKNANLLYNIVEYFKDAKIIKQYPI